MTGTAILCSGQGAQGPGMFDLIADAPEAAAIFDLSTAVLGHDPRALVRQASENDLHANRAGQILCVTQALAAWAVLGDLVPRPLVVAGYSVGELAAWSVAGLLDARDVLGLAVGRASSMDEDVMQPSGLAAIRGLSRSRLELLCRTHECHVAILNAPDQVLVGGTRQALQALVEDADSHGVQRATLLPVAVPSHTPLLHRASERFRDILAKARPAAEIPPDVRLLSGLDGAAVFDLEAGLDKLALQIRQTVDWGACMDQCRAAGVSKIIELGPGTALVRLMKAVMPDCDIHGVAEFRSLDGLKRWIRTAR